MSADELPPDAPRPRLCHLLKWTDFDGYGFNLHAERVKTGQFIGKVDDNSPAESAGLKEGDRIIEVNGVNIANENHKQVVERIKAVPNETKLLVLDDEGDDWYKERNIVVKSSFPNVLYRKTPVPRPSNNSETVNGNGRESVTPSTEEEEDRKSLQSNSSSQASSSSHKEEIPRKTSLDNEKSSPRSSQQLSNDQTDSPAKSTTSNGNTSPVIKPSNGNITPPVNGKTPVNGTTHVNDTTPANGKTPANGTTPANGSTPVNGTALAASNSTSSSSSSSSKGSVSTAMNGLNLNMSAKELREMLASRKKRDPKQDNLDARKKYEIIQGM